MSEKDNKYWDWLRGLPPLLGHDGPLSETGAGVWQWGPTEKNKEEMSQANASTGPDLDISGGQELFVMRNPDPKRLGSPETDDYYSLRLDLEGLEWAALFYDTLRCPMARDNPYNPEIDRDSRAWIERYGQKFRRAILEYPLLGRNCSIHIYVKYEAHEVDRLQEECLRVKSICVDELALSGINKLLLACAEASKGKLGLLLAPD